jgi:hypothetical protein
MKNHVCKNRRNFLKSTAAGVAGLAILGPAMKKACAADLPVKLIPLNTTKINTDIENLRVAYITDAAMVRSGTWGNFRTFNDPANTASGCVYSVVKSNMDKLACALANKTNATEAWDTIFKIPSTKQWSGAKAAIKINSIGDANGCVHASVPIVAKIVEVLMAKGMPASNINVFDMTMSGAKAIYDTFRGAGKSLPAGLVFSGVGGDAGTNNNSYNATFPGGYSMPASMCIDGADIYVNIANNKGHDRYDMFSGVTMCLKNNFGTITFGHSDMDHLAAANSCDYLIGNPSATMPAKQQLCIVDSLWLGNPGDWAGSAGNNNNANSIVMGTFAGAVDYVAALKIRSPKFPAGTGSPAWNQTIVTQFMTKFGYTTADITTIMTETTAAGKGLVDASKIAVNEIVPHNFANLERHGYVRFSVSGNGIRPFSANLYLAQGENARSAAIYTVQGRLVRTLPVGRGTSMISWDGRTDGGRVTGAGNYIVRIAGQKTTAAEQITVRR